MLRTAGGWRFSVWGAADATRGRRSPARRWWSAATCRRPSPGAPGIFALADPERIRELVTAAGFAEPRIEEVAVEWRFEDFDAYWKFLNEVAGGVALAIERLSPARGRGGLRHDGTRRGAVPPATTAATRCRASR